MKINGHAIILKTLVGSHSYGTNIEGSDIDYKGIFIQNAKDLYLNGYKPELKINKDEIYFEIGNFLDLCCNGNPTMLELLYSNKECIKYVNPIFEEIISFRDKFLTKNLKHSFGNYAMKQIEKASGLDKKMNWEKKRIERKSVSDMCSVYPFTKFSIIDKLIKNRSFDSKAINLNIYLFENKLSIINCGLVKIEHFRDCYLLFNNPKCLSYKGIASGKDANDVCLSVIPKGQKPIGILFFHKDAYSTACKEWGDYERWLENRNTLRYVDVEGHSQQIDGKNVLHCVRILETAMEIPDTKSINIKRNNSDYLIEIRRGKHDLKTIIEECKEKLKIMNDNFTNSNLPDKFQHKEFIREFIKRIRENNFNL